MAYSKCADFDLGVRAMAEFMTLEATVARIIREKREALGMTRQGLAKRLGVSHGQPYFWETGHALPGAWSLCLLADEFGCTVDELLGRSGG